MFRSGEEQEVLLLGCWLLLILEHLDSGTLELPV